MLELFEPIYNCVEHAQIVKLPSDKLVAAFDFAVKVMEEKRKEGHHQSDPSKTIKRFLTGMMGEIAVEEVLDWEFVDWGIGTSSQHDNPDLWYLGLEVGIKTVEWGTFPLVNNNFKDPQIICVRLSGDTVGVLGLATPEIQKRYSSPELVLDERAKERKTAFYGFHRLEKLGTYEDLLERYKK